MDFYKICERSKVRQKDGRVLSIDIYPDFRVGPMKDLMVRSKSFYAIWDDEKGMWSKSEIDAQRLVDAELYGYLEDKLSEYGGEEGAKAIGAPRITVATMQKYSSKSWADFKRYISLLPDNAHELDENLTFLNSKVKKEDYVSRRLPYALESGDYSAWDKLVGTLYEPKEREKIEWAIGSIVSGDSKTIQKFCVFYGEAGTGKSTIINIIQKLFDGYYVTFDARALGSSNNQFATEVFRSNPLVAIQHDGDLSRIEDNTKLNSIVSHEYMTINEKNKPQYMSRANCFLFLGTNRPVKITDAKSGIIRRLIDINPSGKKFPAKEYDALMSQIDFELGAIASHCLEVYRDLGKNYYKSYEPREMILKTDAFYNFVEYEIDEFENLDDGGISLKRAYELYNDYCGKANLDFKLPRHKFREELKSYFSRFDDLTRVGERQVRSWYSGFKREKLEAPVLKKEEKSLPLVLDCEKSLLDDILADCPAQYAKEDGTPEMAWSMVKTKLRDIDTRKTHYVLTQKFDPTLIQIDFDMKNARGEKDILKNMEAASKWPKTYGEFSKGGAGIHLAYFYDGDISKVNPVYAKDIEVKVFRGNGALRRRLSKCNNIPIAHLPEGSLPLKEEKMIDAVKLNDELHLRNIIKKCLRKQNHGATRPEVDLIMKVLDDAYESGMSYDVSDMEHDILVFAMNSTNQSDYCVSCVMRMKFQSKDIEKAIEERNSKKVSDDDPIVFFDIEIYPPGIDSDGEENEGLFLICWKLEGEENPVHAMVNPSANDVEALLQMKLVGFNNRKYDNHIVYAALLGYTNAQLYDLSHRIIVEKARDALFSAAYDISYTDVYDFASKKQGLKAWEIELGKDHIEMSIPWDEPAPKSLWPKIIEYCSNDVIATEAVFENRKEDWIARKILADLAGGKVNDTTNSLTLKIVFGDNRKPQLVYTDLATGEQSIGR